ncbi:MAG: hypothetical protein IT430_15305 [Phycisphaerales bacterium]|nr:hypothetical protein [Phycisphaerales bacterium]
MTTMQSSTPTTSPPRPGPPRLPRPASSAARPAAAVATVDPLRVVRQYFWWIALSVVIGAAVGLGAHFIWAWTAPVYSATTTWRINPPKRTLASINDPSSVTGEQMDRSIATVAVMITSPNILRPAITSPEVRRTEWIQEFMGSSGNIEIDNALADLEDRLDASTDGSLLVGITAKGPKKEDLVSILTAINQEYRNFLAKERERVKTGTVAAFRTQRETLESEIQSIGEQIAQRIERDKINLNVESSDQAMALNLIRQSINQRQSDLSLVMASRAAAEQRLSEPSLTFNDDERAAARQAPNIMRLEAEILQLRTDIRDARQRFGDNHRYVTGLEDRLSATEAEFDTELDQVMRRDFLGRLETARNNENSIRQMLSQLETERAAAEARLNDLQKAVEWVNTKKADLARAQARRDALESQITEAVMASQMQDTLQASEAQPPEADALPVFPQLIVMVPLGIFLVAGFTTGAIFLREMTDRRIRGPGCVGVLPHGQVLGVVPHTDEDPSHPKRIELVQVDVPRSVLAESVRHIFAPLSRRMSENGHHSLLLVGGQPGAGCTSLISNLSACFAGSERRVLVIDGNFRRPRIAEVFGVAASPGLGDVLNGAATLDQSVQDSRVEKVSVLTAGSESSRQVDLLTTPRFGRVMAEARQKFDFVLVDAPAAVVSGDWQTLANHVDATVLVVRCMQEERGLVSRLISQLRDAKPEHLGVVINAVRSEAGGYLKRNLKQMDQYQRAGR